MSKISGTNAWEKFDIVLDLPLDATTWFLEPFLRESGTLGR